MERRGHHRDSGCEARREGPALSWRRAMDAMLSPGWLLNSVESAFSFSKAVWSVAGVTGEQRQEHDPADAVMRSWHRSTQAPVRLFDKLFVHSTTFPENKCSV